MTAAEPRWQKEDPSWPRIAPIRRTVSTFRIMGFDFIEATLGNQLNIREATLENQLKMRTDKLHRWDRKAHVDTDFKSFPASPTQFALVWFGGVLTCCRRGKAQTGKHVPVIS